MLGLASRYEIQIDIIRSIFNPDLRRGFQTSRPDE